MQRHKDVKKPGYTFNTFWEHMTRGHTAGKSLSLGMWPLVTGVENELGRRHTMGEWGGTWMGAEVVIGVGRTEALWCLHV